jgi:geranylgeranyl transferase type-1 subunit beta
MEQSTLDVQKHIKYWQRCLKSLLPTDYTSGDSSRMMLAFLILGALDILGAGAEHFPEVERKGLRDWILSCQHPNGGFCGSPNHKYPLGFYSKTKDVDPANLPATFFAIINLSFVGSLRDINRVGLLRWLKTLQREDGSFGELLEKDGKIGGGRDMRYCHFAAGVRWLLRGDLAGSEGNNFQDIDVDGLVKHIRAGEVCV